MLRRQSTRSLIISNGGAVRPFVIDRIFQLFANAAVVANANAALYSLMETANVNGNYPYAYFKRVERPYNYLNAEIVFPIL